MEKNVQISLLLDFYQKMLTEKQAECIDLYYNDDLSLSELSIHFGITRQGVRDNIKRAESVLFNIEERLGLAARFLKIEEKLSEIDDTIREIETSPDAARLPREIRLKINSILTAVEEISEE